jgi:hypothetical protein
VQGSGADTCTGLASAWRSGRELLLVAHDISYWAEPDEKSCSPAFIKEKTRRLPLRRRATCPLSIYCVPSHPLAGGVKVIQQAARLLGLLANSAPVPGGTLYSSSLSQEASPARQGYVDLERQGTRRLPRQQTLEDPISIFFMSLGPHVGA